MGTKCNVVVKDDNGEEKYLYGHCDGAPADAGATVLKVIHALKVERPEYDPVTEEVADWIENRADGRFRKTEEVHTDAKYLYEVLIHRPAEEQAYITMKAFSSTEKNLRDKDVTQKMFASFVEAESMAMLNTLVRHIASEFSPLLEKDHTNEQEEHHENKETTETQETQLDETAKPDEKVVTDGEEPWSGN